MTRTVEDQLVVRMEATLRRFERQMEGGVKAAQGFSRKSQRSVNAATKSIEVNAVRAGKGLQGMFNISGAGRFVIQNTSAQIGDMVVQLQSGTDAGRVMGQQLPQLFGGFGALGGALGVVAPLLGTVAALGAPLAFSLLRAGEATQSLDDRMQSLEKSIEAVKAAQAASGRSTQQLVDEYGGLAEEAQAVFEINRQIAAIHAQDSLDSAARGIADQLGVEGVFGFGPEEIRDMEATIGSLKDRIEELRNQPSSTHFGEDFQAGQAEIAALLERIKDLRRLSGNMDDLAASLGITASEAREVAAQFAAIGQAKGPEEQARAMSDLTDFIYGASRNLKDADDEGEKLYETLRTAATQALKLAGIDIAGNLSVATDEAKNLAEWLGLSLETAAKIAALGPQGAPGASRGGRGGDPRTMGGSLEDWQNRDATVFLENYRAPRQSSRGGRGSRERVSDTRREADALVRATRTAEGYQAVLAELNAMHSSGEISSDQYSQAVDNLAQRYKDVAQSGTDLASVQRGLKDAILDMADGGTDSLDQLARAFRRAALEAALFGKNGSGGLFGAIGFGGKTGLLGGAIIPGILHSGGTAGVDGYGHGRAFSASTWAGAPRYHKGGIAGLKPGEIPAILERGEPVLPKGTRLRSAGTANGGLTVNIHNAPEGAHQVQHSADGRTLDIHLENRAIEAVTGPKGQRAMRNTYGLRPAVQGR